jgi:hypothetical protein
MFPLGKSELLRCFFRVILRDASANPASRRSSHTHQLPLRRKVLDRQI